MPIRPPSNSMLSNPPGQVRIAGRCICGKRMGESWNEGTCLWCGHGQAKYVIEQAYRINAENRERIDAARAPRSNVIRLSLPKKRSGWTEEMCIDAALEWEIDHGRLPNTTDWKYTGGLAHPTYVTVIKLFGGWSAFKRAIAAVPREQVAA